ncbi:MAG: hypothetical protein A2087_01525 [Spirochaetes bacterium GWD1_61_31]|nr:MAG: hypothetical protein A2Y37_12425 [Spirochaetes bacterium GWB1_60_80]OHD30175.1 MAG: hypothetical protein A2004_14290 [Spirochaetes bacterium GWC1_61_12]OHD35874.1 MAG: hypothetical protein A2087_01525 [Spirochaetes bacterium GWD1_61_31]OHD42165.1 MAG: hypothetical protein A2Y35_06510 [Spirochaetes bacterium GWE1_60_18]OHD59441.1 MAG: hypothetical protein A2Y32_09950 [Spirochaetes bacterium GWF1_60_12]HAP44045.1 hypothetical protein [Spirochaetaceae bacterium]
MQLDVITLFWVLGLSYLANLMFSVLLFGSGTSFPGASHWIVAQSSLAGGMLLLAIRQTMPYAVVAVGNSLVLAANLLYFQAARIFAGRKPLAAWWYCLVAVALVVFLLPLSAAPVSVRTACFSSLSMVGSLAIYRQLSRRLARAEHPGARWAALPFLFIAAGNLLQLAGALIFPASYDIGHLNPLYPLVLLASILTAPISLFGYFLLAGMSRQEAMAEQQRLLGETNLALRKTNQTKDLFVSILAHDLRSPLAGAARYVRKNLLTGLVDPAQRQHALEVLAQSLEKTHIFLENVLWWSRAQREDWVSKCDDFDLVDVARSAIGMAMPSIDAKGLILESALQPAPVRADSDSVLLILHNLLSNAIKFSQPGGLIEVISGRESSGGAFISLTDRGIGIKPELREKLLQIETKISTPGTLGETGSGMGLILCWEFARLNGARLMLTSEPGLGTTVRLSFDPDQPAAETTKGAGC